MRKVEARAKDFGEKHCFISVNYLQINMWGKAIFQFAPS